MGQTARIDVGSPAPRALGRMLFAGGVYLLWVAATWFLEKRVGLFARYDPVGRTTYAVVANVLVGTVLAALAMRRIERPFGEPRTRPLLLALVAIAGGAFVAKAAPPGARDPIVFVNAFAQILPTSIAEVVTCWLLVGAAVQLATRRAGRVPATVLGVLVGDLVFAVYHVAHSAPFDQPAMIAFLALPGLVTGVIVLVARDWTAGILAQNLFAMIGVTKSADLDVFRHPFVWAYAVAAIAVGVAVVALGRSGAVARPRILS